MILNTNGGSGSNNIITYLLWIEISYKRNHSGQYMVVVFES